MLTVVLLIICTCTYIHSKYPTLLDRHQKGLMGTFWKAARIGERLSPYVSVACLVMGVLALKE
jgi:hypothetical protein